ncbi:50S ribosomal protein L23 [bacterium]|nr:50S ribosomal protein L23 [bacterium]
MSIFQFKKERKEDKGKEEKEDSLPRRQAGRLRGNDIENGNNIKKEKVVGNSQKPKSSEVRAVDKDKADKTAGLEKSGKKENDFPPKEQSEIACRVLVEPWVTERSHNLMALNKYIFKVARFSNKNQVKRAIEELYNVKVIKINIINIPPKKRNFARKTGWKSGYKKAVITLKEGDKIEMSNH